MATQTIKNHTDLDKAVAHVGRLQSWIENEKARLKKSVDSHQRRIDARKVASALKTRRWEYLLGLKATEVFDYVDGQRTELFEDGSSFCKVATGRIGYEEAREGATEFLEDEAAAVAAIESRLPKEVADRILKKEVRKSELKAVIREDPTIATKLADVTDIPLVDRFVIDPDNSQKAFRRVVQWFRRPSLPEAA